MKISVIVGYHDEREYIGKALESLKNQNFKDFEVIICDDNSNIKCNDIIDNYKKYLNIKYFTTSNESYNSPSEYRNLGISQSNGEYLMFLDADDKLPNNSLSILNEKIESDNESVVFSGKSVIKSNNEFFNNEIVGDLLLHGKLFKTDFLRKNNLFFVPFMKIYEDIIFIKEIKKIIDINNNKINNFNNVIHEYYLRDDSVTNGPKRWKNLLEYQILGRVILNEKIIKINNSNYNIKESIKLLFEACQIYNLFDVWNKYNTHIWIPIHLYQIKLLVEKIIDIFNIDKNKLFDIISKSPLLYGSTYKEISGGLDGGWHGYPFVPKHTIFDIINMALDYKKKFSIVIPCYNCKETITGVLDSILKQGYRNYEVIICDDRSNDGFMKKVIPYEYKMNIRYYCTKKGEPKGPANARNLGIEKAEGEWIIFIDSDDNFTEGTFDTIEKCTEHTDTLVWGGFSNGPEVYFDSRIGLHGKCFNRKFLNDFNIRFNSNLYTEEDYNFVNKVLVIISGEERIYYKMPQNFYIHNIDNKNSMTHVIKENYIFKTFNDFLDGYMEPFINGCTKYPHIKEWYNESCLYNLLTGYNRFQYLLNIYKEEEIEEKHKKLLYYFDKYKEVFGVNDEQFLKLCNDTILTNSRLWVKNITGDFRIITEVKECFKASTIHG